jgi:nickel-dependent lactate racemase
VEGCDGIVSIGVIEPHLYAGYSGCAKTIAMGIAGERTINVTHHPRFLDDEGVAVGSIESNPFQSTLWDIVRRLPFLFALNVVNDHDGNAVEVFAGEPRDVFERGVAFARRVYALEVGRRADVVVCGVGHPKDVNLYQASRAINYVVNSPRPILREGGFLVVVAEMRDGLGDGIGERRCFKALRSMRSPEGFIEEIKAHGCLGGEHRAYMIAKAMAKAKVIVVGERAPQIMRGLPMVAFKTIAEAMRYVEKAAGRESTVYVVPRALSTVVSVRG